MFAEFDHMARKFCQKQFEKFEKKSNGTQSKQLRGVVPYQQQA